MVGLASACPGSLLLATPMYVTIIITYMQACKLALDEGWAINIGGGFSYYTTNTGGGLAVYDDVTVCLAVSEYTTFACTL